jgi:cytochrome c-type biogenesis protein CcmE
MKARSKRLLVILGGLASVGVASALVLNALDSNVAFFFTPTQVSAGELRTASSTSASTKIPNTLNSARPTPRPSMNGYTSTPAS